MLTGISDQAAITALLSGPPVLLREPTRMTCATYDIFRKETLGMVWIEAARDLQSARLRVRELAASSDAEYVIYDQRARKIVTD